MTRLSILIFIILFSNAFAQRQVILSSNSSGWSYTRSLGDDHTQFSPEQADSDFWGTWFDHSVDGYFSPLTYDGPPFLTNQQAPFSAGNVPGITGGTSLDLPADATWQYGYFLKEVNGGTTGYKNLNLRILARDGAVVYLNGEYLGATPTLINRSDQNPTIYREGDGATFLDLNLAPSIKSFLRPGPNLLAVVAGRANGQTEDFGIKIELSGESGIPPITPYTMNTEGNRIHLRWSTADPQKTIVKVINSSNGNDTEIIQSATATRNHHFTHEVPYSNSIHGFGRTYVLLKPDLQYWEQDFVNGLRNTAHFSAPGFETKIIFTYEDTDWHYLQVRDPGGNTIDPALSDPDFHQSWFRQIPPGFGMPPFEALPYDGPAFTQASTPIHYGTAQDFPNAGTTLTPPIGGEGHTLWLYRTIDGGTTGYNGLHLDLRLRGEASVYLNGKLLQHTNNTLAPDSWPNPSDERHYTQGKSYRYQYGHLNPGPNLLAVAVHNNSQTLGFSAELRGETQPLFLLRDLKTELFGNTFSLSYLTSVAQPTTVKIGPSNGDLTTYQIPGDRIFHEIEVPDLEENITYSYEITIPNPDHLPWDPPTRIFTGQFTPTSTTIINQVSSDWQVFHSLDNDSLGTDPSLADPDFNTTWMTLGMTGSLYDGPAFTPDQNAPFRITGIESGLGGTSLTHPGEDNSGALYLVKEITGFEQGAWSLDFNLTTPRAYQIYLNGDLIIDDLGLNQPTRSWDLYWQHQSRRPTQKPASLRPGKNVLAISLHPKNENTPALDFDITLTGLTDFSAATQMSPLASPNQDDSTTTIQWFTNTPSGTSLRYGISRSDMSNSVTLTDSTFVHTVNLPNPFPGQRLYYEILQADGSSYNPPAINSSVAAPKTIIPFASQWSYLFPSNPDTSFSIDPALLDPDFYQTWSTQSFGTYSGNTDYDGPTFSPLLAAPFGHAATNPGTVTPKHGAAWLLKELDGGSTGFHQLQLTGIRNTPMTLFLNGNKIAEAHLKPASQAIWAERGDPNAPSMTLLPATLILPPGPNLIAVQMHLPYSADHHTFDLSLTGLPLDGVNTTPSAITKSATTADLTWATASPQSTRLRWGPALSSLTNSVELPGDRTYHTHTLPDLTPSTTYFVEVLDGSGNSHTPPILSSVRTEDQVLVARQSSGWSLLESISNGAFVDPAATDPDFLTTWFDPASYDGPAFTPNQSSPFATQGRHLRVGQTHLQTIDRKIRPVWLLKEIDGGETGYQSLTLEAIYDRAFAVYLNGQIIAAPNLGSNDPFGSWNLSSNINAAGNTNLSLGFPESITLTPGPNTLAIALHPTRFDLNGTLTGEFELRGAPPKFSISQPTLQYLSSTQINLTWNTTQPTSTRFSYGLDPLSLENVVEDPELKTGHQITSIDFVEGGTYIFEIVATDSLGNTATSVGTFQILPQVMRLPFLQKAAPTTMTVNWRTRDPGDTLIRYGQDPANLDQILTGTSAPAPLIFTTGPNEIITDHSVTLSGLTPATKYFYQIASDNSPAPASDLEQFFTTPPLTGTPAKTRIWVLGDSGQPGQGVRDVKEAYLQFTADTPTDLWLMLGDNAYNSGTDSEYQRGLFDIFPEILKNTPVWPTMGNHEGYSGKFYGIFELPTNGQSGGVPSGTEKYYSFDHGNIHFICLNSEETPPGMINWLKSDLQSTRADWLIAFFHHGAYTKGSHDSDRESKHFLMRQTFLPILEDYGVDLILSGHSHQYERSHLLNGHYFTSPTYRAEEHALDPGPGSPLGITDRQTGIFKYTNDYAPYQKPLAAPNSGQVSATVGASSKLSGWSDTAGGDRYALTHPNPHPVHLATLRALGSMIIDVEGHTLQAKYLDSNGQVRDHFEIQKSPDTGPAITWWQQNFGPDSSPHFPDWFADTDQDSHNNLTEFALGGDPLVKDRLIEAVLTTDRIPNGPSVQWFTVQYDLREGHEISVQAAQNLIQFTESGIETRRLTEPDAKGIARWESRVRRTTQTTLFFRIVVSR
jgi:hypothetical protein